jgi:hypothetical protein
MNYNFKINGQDLNKEQYDTLTNFILYTSRKNFTRIIYRGESIDNLKEKLNILPHENFYEKLNYFTFKIGEKSRVYQERHFKNLKDKSLVSINDLSEKTFKYIFNKINKVLTESKDPEIKEFINNNDDFCTFFHNKKNLNDFIFNIQKLNNKQKLKARDYYLSFLHRVGQLGFYQNSFFLSTTTSKTIAEKFTKEDDIIFVSWATFKYIKKETNELKINNLPTFNKNIFEYQDEISIKGGLFPQRIIGFIDRNINTFHLNPNIFFFPDLVEYMVDNGIPIDQDDFDQIRSLTNYSGFFTHDGTEYNDDIN